MHVFMDACFFVVVVGSFLRVLYTAVSCTFNAAFPYGGRKAVAEFPLLLYIPRYRVK